MPSRVETTWWEYAGRYSAFDDHGISSPIMRDLATGEERASHDLPVGALFAAWRDVETYPKGADGLTVWCVVPDAGGRHQWLIDGRANNCTAPDDKTHRCWVRHGTVGDRITVDKNGLTCAAGGGSIQTSGYHGVLRDGVLVGD